MANLLPLLGLIVTSDRSPLVIPLGQVSEEPPVHLESLLVDLDDLLGGHFDMPAPPVVAEILPRLYPSTHVVTGEVHRPSIRFLSPYELPKCGEGLDGDFSKGSAAVGDRVVLIVDLQPVRAGEHHQLPRGRPIDITDESLRFHPNVAPYRAAIGRLGNGDVHHLPLPLPGAPPLADGDGAERTEREQRDREHYEPELRPSCHHGLPPPPDFS